MAREKNTPNDPERGERIVTATMNLLREAGVASVTARSVAARAEVPVGSVSYYFDSVKGLLLQASRELLNQRATQISEWDYEDSGAEGVLWRVAELMHHQITEGHDLTVVSYELYLLGLRDPDFQEISQHTVDTLRQKLTEHFPAERAAHLAAAADGLQLHLLLTAEPVTPSMIFKTLKAA